MSLSVIPDSRNQRLRLSVESSISRGFGLRRTRSVPAKSSAGAPAGKECFTSLFWQVTFSCAIFCPERRPHRFTGFRADDSDRPHPQLRLSHRGNATATGAPRVARTSLNRDPQHRREQIEGLPMAPRQGEPDGHQPGLRQRRAARAAALDPVKAQGATQPRRQGRQSGLPKGVGLPISPSSSPVRQVIPPRVKVRLRTFVRRCPRANRSGVDLRFRSRFHILFAAADSTHQQNGAAKCRTLSRRTGSDT